VVTILVLVEGVRAVSLPQQDCLLLLEHLIQSQLARVGMVQVPDLVAMVLVRSLMELRLLAVVVVEDISKMEEVEDPAVGLERTLPFQAVLLLLDRDTLAETKMAHAAVLVVAVLVGLVDLILGTSRVMAVLDYSQAFPGLLLITLVVVVVEPDMILTLGPEDPALVAMAAKAF
jgi:hypothetical protein